MDCLNKTAAHADMCNNISEVECSGSVGRALDWGSKGLYFETHQSQCCVLEYDT